MSVAWLRMGGTAQSFNNGENFVTGLRTLSTKERNWNIFFNLEYANVH